MNFKKRKITLTNKNGSEESLVLETLDHLAITGNDIIGGWDIVDIESSIRLKTCKTKPEAKENCRYIIKTLNDNRIVEL
jgi:hypothetical protein